MFFFFSKLKRQMSRPTRLLINLSIPASWAGYRTQFSYSARTACSRLHSLSPRWVSLAVLPEMSRYGTARYSTPLNTLPETVPGRLAVRPDCGRGCLPIISCRVRQRCQAVWAELVLRAGRL